MTMIRNPSKRKPSNSKRGENSEHVRRRTNDHVVKDVGADNNQDTTTFTNDVNVTSTTIVDDKKNLKTNENHHHEEQRKTTTDQDNPAIVEDKLNTNTTTTLLSNHNDRERVHSQARGRHRQMRQQQQQQQQPPNEPKKQQIDYTQERQQPRVKKNQGQQQQQQHVNHVVIQRLHRAGHGDVVTSEGEEAHNDSSKMAQIHEMHPHRYSNQIVDEDDEEEEDIRLRGIHDKNKKRHDWDGVPEKQYKDEGDKENADQKDGTEREKRANTNTRIRQQEQPHHEDDHEEHNNGPDSAFEHEETVETQEDERHKENNPQPQRHSRLREPPPIEKSVGNNEGDNIVPHEPTAHRVVDPGPLIFGPSNDPDLLIVTDDITHRGKGGGGPHHVHDPLTSATTNATAGTVPPMDFYSVVALVFAIGGFVVIVLLLFTPTTHHHPAGGNEYYHMGEKRTGAGGSRRKHNKKKHSPGVGGGASSKQQQNQQGSTGASVKSRRSIKKKQDDYYYESDYEPIDHEDDDGDDGAEFLDDSLDDLILFQKEQQQQSTTNPQGHHHYHPMSTLTHRVVAAASNKQQAGAGGGTIVSNLPPPPPPIIRPSPMTPSHHWMMQQQQQQQQQQANVSPVPMPPTAAFAKHRTSAPAPPPPPPVMFSLSGPPSSTTSNSSSESYNRGNNPVRGSSPDGVLVQRRASPSGLSVEGGNGSNSTSTATGRQSKTSAAATASSRHGTNAPLQHAGLSGFLSPPAFVDHDEDLTTEDDHSDFERSRGPPTRRRGGTKNDEQTRRRARNTPVVVHVSPTPTKSSAQPTSRHRDATNLEEDEEDAHHHKTIIHGRPSSTHLDTLLVDSDVDDDEQRSHNSNNSKNRKNLVYYHSASSNDEFEFGEDDDDDVSVALEQGDITMVVPSPPSPPAPAIARDSPSYRTSPRPSPPGRDGLVIGSNQPQQGTDSSSRSVTTGSPFQATAAPTVVPFYHLDATRPDHGREERGSHQEEQQQRRLVNVYDGRGLSAATSTCSSVSLSETEEEQHYKQNHPQPQQQQFLSQNENVLVHHDHARSATPAASPNFQRSTAEPYHPQQQPSYYDTTASGSFSPNAASPPPYFHGDSAAAAGSSMRSVVAQGNGSNQAEATPRIHNAGDRYVGVGARPLPQQQRRIEGQENVSVSPGPPAIPNYNYSSTCDDGRHGNEGYHLVEGNRSSPSETQFYDNTPMPPAFVPFLPNLSKTGVEGDSSSGGGSQNSTAQTSAALPEGALNENRGYRKKANNDSDSLLLLDPYLNAPQNQPGPETVSSIDFGGGADAGGASSITGGARGAAASSGDTEFSFAIPSEGKPFRKAMSTDETTTFSSSVDHDQYAMLHQHHHHGGATSYDEVYSEDYDRHQDQDEHLSSYYRNSNVKRTATKAARQRRKMSNEELEEYMKSQVRIPESPFAPRPTIQGDGTTTTTALQQKSVLPFPDLDNLANVSNNYNDGASSTYNSATEDEEEEQETGVKHVRKNLVKEDSDASASLSGYIKFQDLNLIEVIGGGGFGQVYRATWHGTPVAVKVINTVGGASPSKKVLEEFAAEINLLSGMRHPNICLYIGACLEPPNFAIVTELAANGSLWDALRLPINSSNDAYQVCDGWTYDGWPASLYELQQHRGGGLISNMRTKHHNENDEPAPPPAGTWPWALVKKVASGAARGMTYLHSGTPPVLHRDLKSANLLLDESYNAKVCDFGLSRLKAQERSMTGNCGTVQWMAPEVLANERYAEPADVFSFGVILWELLCRECPYDGMDPIPCALAVLNKRERPTIPPWCPPSFATLIRQCWDQNPTNRPTFLQVLAALDDMD